MSARQLEVRITSVYGTPTCYPVNEQAKLFAEVAGTKTLTARTLVLALDLGFSIREVRGGDAVEEFIKASRKWPRRCDMRMGPPGPVGQL